MEQELLHLMTTPQHLHGQGVQRYLSKDHYQIVLAVWQTYTDMHKGSDQPVSTAFDTVVVFWPLVFAAISP